MSTADRINAILKRIAENKHTDADLQMLRQLIVTNDSQSIKQLGKYNTSIVTGKEIQIGDRTYSNWDNGAIADFVTTVRATNKENPNPEYFRTIEACKERNSLEHYFKYILLNLREQQHLELQRNAFKNGRLFNYIARISEFDLGQAIKSEAYLFFSEFSSINKAILQQYSSQCLQIAKAAINPSNKDNSNLSYIYFAIAIVDCLNEEVIDSILTTNPIEDNIDSRWYKIPVVCELSKQKLYFYEKSQDLGKKIWKESRIFIKNYLSFPDLQKILNRIKNHEYSYEDITVLRELILADRHQTVLQLSKYNINLGDGKDIHIGDRIYQEWDDKAIQALVKAIREAGWQCIANLTENDYTQVENQATGIGLIDKLAKQLTDFSQQSTMRYGLKLAFSPNSDREYFVSSGNQVIKRWQINSWEILQEISVPFSLTDTFDLWFTSVAISPDCQFIAACKAYQIYVWQLGKEKPIYTFGKTLLSNFFDVFGFDSVTFSPDGKILATNDNQNIKLWSVETGKEVATLSGHSDKVTCVAFNPNNGRILASCSYDKTIKLWDIQTKRCLGTLTNHRDSIYTLVFSPDGEMLASGSNDNTIRIWYPNTGEMPQTLRHHSDGVTCLVFHPNGKSLFSGSNDKAIIEWTVEGEVLSVFSEQHPRGVTSIAISPDGETLISAGRDQTIKVWRR